MQIKDLAIGDGYVYLMEGGSKIKFYVLAHNYESGLNGKGRTLFCRKEPVMSGIHNTSNTNGFYPARNEEVKWYSSTYISRFTAAVKAWIGTTTYKVQSCHGDSTMGRFSEVFTYTSAFFPISLKELNGSISGMNIYGSLADGSVLSSVARSRIGSIQRSYGSGIWTRSPYPSSSGYYKDDGDNVYAFGYSCYIASASGSGVNYGYSDTGSFGYLPCFTLPETLYIDKDGFPTVNQPPEVTSDVGASGAKLGEKNAPFTVGYTVTDGDGDPMRIVEKVNGVELAVRENVATGTELIVQCLSEKSLFQQILNGENTLTLEVDDGKTTTEWTATFTKNVTSAILSLTQPLTADDTITVAALTLEGSFPADMSLTVEMTNNGLDDTPVWENCTDIQSGESRTFVHHAFANKTAARGFAFNYKVTISRGASGVGGSVTMIGGVIG